MFNRRLIWMCLLPLLISSCNTNQTNSPSDLSSSSSLNSGETNSEFSTSYTITWVNYDGAVLKKDKNIEYGVMPSYDGTTPNKPKDSQYTYSFCGWFPSLEPVTHDITYKAQFDSTINCYTITWKNENGAILEIDENVPYGTVPTYDSLAPSKEGNSQYSYTFSSWFPAIESVKGDATYVANYRQETKTYTITWKNYDGETLEIDSNVPYGTMPTYNSTMPMKSGNSQYAYAFLGWSPQVVPVEGNTTYFATFETQEKPTISSGFAYFGYYPQTEIKDESLKIEIDKIAKNTGSNIVEYGGEKYRLGSGYDGNHNKKTFCCKYEPIRWKVVNETNNKKVFMATKVLDFSIYGIQKEGSLIKDKDLKYAWANSQIRSFLNNTFLSEAFGNKIPAYIDLVCNSNSFDEAGENVTVDNYEYEQGDTYDYCYLLSKKELQNYEQQIPQWDYSDYSKISNWAYDDEHAYPSQCDGVRWITRSVNFSKSRLQTKAEYVYGTYHDYGYSSLNFDAYNIVSCLSYNSSLTKDHSGFGIRPVLTITY